MILQTFSDMGDIVKDERCSLDPVSTQAQVMIHENLDLFPMKYRSKAKSLGGTNKKKLQYRSFDEYKRIKCHFFNAPTFN